MNKKEAIELLSNNTYRLFGSENEGVPLEIAIGTVQLIGEPAKVVVPKVAIEYYEKYKDKLTGFDDWFSEFYYEKSLEEFPQAEQLSEWLYGNDNYTNRQRELALATLIVNGPDAVEVEQEQLYTVEIPDPNSYCDYRYLSRNDNGICLDASNDTKWKQKKRNQLTEAEIRKDFEWAWDAGFAEPVEVQEVE